MIKTINLWTTDRVQLLEHLPYVALCVRKDNVCDQLKTNINKSRINFCGEGKRRNEFAEWHVAWLAE